MPIESHSSLDLVPAMSSALSGFGGYLRCETCLTTAALGDPGRRVAGGQGWPKCCGYTMRWWTQSQVDTGEVPPPRFGQVSDAAK